MKELKKLVFIIPFFFLFLYATDADIVDVKTEEKEAESFSNSLESLRAKLKNELKKEDPEKKSDKKAGIKKEIKDTDDKLPDQTKKDGETQKEDVKKAPNGKKSVRDQNESVPDLNVKFPIKAKVKKIKLNTLGKPKVKQEKKDSVKKLVKEPTQKVNVKKDSLNKTIKNSKTVEKKIEIEPKKKKSANKKTNPAKIESKKIEPEKDDGQTGSLVSEKEPAVLNEEKEKPQKEVEKESSFKSLINIFKKKADKKDEKSDALKKGEVKSEKRASEKGEKSDSKIADKKDGSKDDVEKESSKSGIRKGALKPITETLIRTKPDIKWEVSGGKIIWSAIFFFFSFVLIKYSTRILESIAEHWGNTRLFIKKLIPIIRIIGWILVIYFIITAILSPPIESIIAVTASAGIAMGFAAQDILKNIFGGIMVLFDNPFQVGDKIQIGSYYGEVVHIGLRSVRIVTPDDSLVSIPNSEIVSQSVSNSNAGEFNCQVVSEFFLPAHIPMLTIKSIAYSAAVTSKYIYLNKPVAIVVKNEIYEGKSMLKVRLKAYVLDLRDEFPFASEMTEIVMEELFDRKIMSKEDMYIV